MCGIAGIVAREPRVVPAVLSQMGAALAHRGPDGAGLKCWHASGAECAGEEPGVLGLAHRRLKIIDLSEAAAQPMSNEDASVWIVFNGEVYGFQALRQELIAKGHVFRSQSDTEVLLHLYEEYGVPDMLRRLNGMFAFALWDARDRRLILACDRVGKKPLYYRLLSDGTLVFASEIKALKAGGYFDAGAVDELALAQVWTVAATVGERTVFGGVRRLRPAHYAVWSQGQLETVEYWDAPFGVEPATQSLDDLADELEALLGDAIRLRMVADVPLGLFLSGGIDSSLLAALAARKLDVPVETFTIGFAEQAFDESRYAARIATHLGLKNMLLKMDQPRSEDVATVARQFDEPFGDASAVPTWMVSKLARQHVTVALTGDGGDEVFAGYESFRQALRIWGGSAERRPFLRKLTLPEWAWECRVRWGGFPASFMRLDGKISRRARRQVFQPGLYRAARAAADLYERQAWLAKVPDADLLSQLQYVTFHTWLPDVFLRKVDMMSMAHALECRCPFLDYRVVEFAARLPWAAKYDEQGNGKRLLRHLLARYVPSALFERPKQGFYAPWENWCRGPAAERMCQRWRQWRNPWFKSEAARWIFPENRLGTNFLQWNAFASMETLDRN